MCRVRTAILLLGLALWSSSSFAGAVKWTGLGGTDLWSEGANWQGGSPPGLGEDAVFDDAGVKDCVLDGSYDVKKLSIRDGYTGTITIPSGSALSASDDFSCEGRIVVEGTLTLLDTANNQLKVGAVTSGDLEIGPGGSLLLAPGAPFHALPGTTFVIAGTSGNPGVVDCTVAGSAPDDFVLECNVDIDWAEFRALNDMGLQLTSPTGESVAAGNVTLFSSGKTLVSDNQHLFVDGDAWNYHVFSGFSFESGPDYAVESNYDIIFVDYDEGPGTMYGDSATDPAGSGNVTWGALDLFIVSIVPSNSNPAADEPISITVTVGNAGSSLAANFRVDLFLDAAFAPNIGDPGDSQQIVPSLAGGASVEVVFTAISYPGGTHDFYATVDGGFDVTELDEGNNVGGPVQVPWDAAGTPDLTVTDITPLDAAPGVGQTISVDVTILNEGTGTAGTFRVDLFYDRGVPPTVGEAGDDYQHVGTALASGNTTVVTFTGITSLVRETWSLYSIVDTTDTVGESDESDNISGPVTVTWGYIRWTGAVNSDWSVGGNWEGGVKPGTANFAVFDSSSSVDCTVDEDVRVARISIDGYTGTIDGQGFAIDIDGDFAQTSGTFTSTTATMNVGGDFVRSGGVFVHNGGRVLLDGPQDQAVASGGSSFYDVEVNSAGHTVTFGDDVTVAGDLTVAAGTLVLGTQATVGGRIQIGPGAAFNPLAATVTCGGDFVNDGSYDNTGGETIFNGATSVGGTTVTTFDVLTATGGGTVAFAADSFVDGTLTVDAGSTLTLGTGQTLGLNTTCTLDGSLVCEAGSVLQLAGGTGLTVTETGSFQLDGIGWAAGEYALVTSTGFSSVELRGDVSVAYSRFENLSAAGLVLSGSAGAATTSMANVQFRSSEGGAGSTHMLISDTDWDNYTFNGFSFEGTGADDPQYAVEITSGGDVWMQDYDSGAGRIFEDSYDNEISGTVTWDVPSEADLIVESIVPSVDVPVTGSTISIDVSVRNQGNVAVSSFDVGLFYNPGAVPSPGDMADKTENVPSLGIGELAVVTFLGVSSAVTESWNVYAIADNGPGPTVTESDETNNVGGPVTVSWELKDLQILAIVPTDRDPDIVVDIISVDVTVQNVGESSSGLFDVGLFYDCDTPPSVGDTPDQQITVSLGANTQTVVSFMGISGSSLTTWRMYAVADVAGDAVESDETNNVAGPVSVTWHGADLVIAAIVPSVARPDFGDNISIDVVVLNIGDRDAGAFDVGLFLDEVVPPTPGDIADDTKPVVSLVAGTQTVVTFTGITSPVETLWYTYAIADNGLIVTEGDETNNVGGPVNISWEPLPDLVVVSVVPSESEPVVGGTIDVTVTIANEGKGDATLFDVALYYNLAAPPAVGDLADGTLPVVGVVASGEQRVLQFFGITHPVPEVWQMYVLVDSGGGIEEGNESNNTGGPVEVNWGGIPGITLVTPNGGEVWESGTTQRIVWDSVGDIGSVTVTLDYSTDGGTSWVSIAESTPDDEVFEWLVPPEDTLQALVRVSSPGGPYSDTSDNVFTITPAKTDKPNLTIVSVTPESVQPDVGSVITVEVTVRNTGTADAGLAFVDLFYDRSSPPSAGDTGSQAKYFNDLAVGAQITLTFTGISSPTAGVWDMYAMVDTRDFVSESDESDNVFGPVAIGWGTTIDSFTVVKPNGGEKLERKERYTIRWSSTLPPGELVNLEVSTDGGATWSLIAAATENDGAYAWNVLAPTSTDCRLRISSLDGNISDVSDDVFTILGEGANAMSYFGGGCRAANDGYCVGLLPLLLFAAVALGLPARKRRLTEEDPERNPQ